MFDRSLIAALALATSAFAAPAFATTVALPADGTWAQFTVDPLLAQSSGLEWIDDSDGSALRFDFTIAAGSVGSLTVVDGVFGGDTFQVTNFGALLGSTAPVPLASYTDASFGSALDLGFDFDAALGTRTFSQGIFTLAAGSYSIGGSLLQSVLFNGDPLNSTAGAVRLDVESVSAVPEPSTYALLAAGLGVLALTAKRRRG